MTTKWEGIVIFSRVEIEVGSKNSVIALCVKAPRKKERRCLFVLANPEQLE